MSNDFSKMQLEMGYSSLARHRKCWISVCLPWLFAVFWLTVRVLPLCIPWILFFQPHIKNNGHHVLFVFVYVFPVLGI